MKPKAKAIQILALGCALFANRTTEIDVAQKMSTQRTISTSVGDIAAGAGAIFQTVIGKDGLA